MNSKHIGKTRRNASGNFWTQCSDYVLRIEKNMKKTLSSGDGLCPSPSVLPTLPHSLLSFSLRHWFTACGIFVYNISKYANVFWKIRVIVLLLERGRLYTWEGQRLKWTRMFDWHWDTGLNSQFKKFIDPEMPMHANPLSTPQHISGSTESCRHGRTLEEPLIPGLG